MNWLKHWVALAAKRTAYTLFGDRLGCLDGDDAQQEAAIRMWQHQGQPADTRTAERVVFDIMRREGAVTRDGVVRVDRTRNMTPLDEAPESADEAPGPEQLAIRAQALQQAVQRLARMPERHQQVVTGILQGEDFETIGMRLDPPCSTVRVSQMLRQVLIQLDGREPWKVERGDQADTSRRPQPHAVRVAHALQAVQARSRLESIIDCQRARLKAFDTSRIEAEAAAGRELHRLSLGD